MRASIIIPTRDRARDLAALLDGIARTGLTDYEVIVVDDGSKDGTAERCGKQPGARLIRLETPGGPARARNLGAASARGEVLVFADSDVLLPAEPDLLAEMVEVLEERPGVDYVITASDVAPLSPSAVAYNYSVYHAYYMERLLAGRPEVEGPAMFFTTRLGCIRRSRFKASGGFRDSLWTVMNEDGEFGTRLFHLGYRAYLRRGFVHQHRFQTRLSAMAPNYFRTAMVQAHIDARYDTSPDPSVGRGELVRRLLALAAIALTATLAALPLRSWWPACAGLWAAWLASLNPLHRLVFRHVPMRLWPAWHIVYALVTPAIVAGYAYGLARARLGSRLLSGRPSELPFFSPEPRE